MSIRTEKVASMIKEEVGTLFQRKFPLHEYGLLTVTDVSVTGDLKHARIYISVFGDGERKKKTLALLEGQKGFVRSELARAMSMRSIPALTFELDDTMDRAMRLETIFKEIHKEDPDKQS